MSSARSNMSNESSCSHILSLSRDSNSSQIKLPANAYYKKFISRLTQFFKMDSQDLDLLYDKIVQCVNESERFIKSNDNDINELIEKAEQIESNNSILKNIVEVLDQKYLKNNQLSKNRSQHAYSNKNEHIYTPKSKTLANNVHVEVTPVVKKNGIPVRRQQGGERITSESSLNSNNSYFTEVFGNTLQKAREELKKKKEQESKQQKEKQEQNKRQIITITKKQQNKQQVQKNEKSKLLLNKIQQQIKDIKISFNKMASNQPQPNQAQAQDPQVSLALQNSPLNNSKTAQSQLIDVNQYENQQEGHLYFQKISQDQYQLVDDRFYAVEPVEKNNEPQFTTKNIYKKQENHQDENRFSKNKQKLHTIIQNSKESDASSHYHQKQNSNAQSFTDYNENIRDQVDESREQREFEKKYSVSNVTIIDKLASPTQSNQKNTQEKRAQRNTNTSIMEKHGIYENMQNSAKKNNQIGSIQTMVVNNSIVEQKSKQNVVQTSQMPEGYKKSQFYTKILESNERNDENRKKINDYLLRLNERNRILGQYVENIEKSYSKQKQKHLQINISGHESNQSKSSYNLNIQTLSNSIYTENEIIIPKYVPPPSQVNIQLNVTTQTIIHSSKPLAKSQDQYLCLSEANQKIKVAEFSNNLYSHKEMNQFPDNEDHQIQHRGMRPIVPMLINLVQNQQRQSKRIIEQENQQSKESPKIKLKNELYLGKQQQQVNKEIEMHETSSTSQQKQKISEQRVEENEKSEYSSQDRVDKVNSLQNSNENPLIINHISPDQLYEQTRNVESKMQISQDRGYKTRGPGEEIQKIKDRMNQMFKKMKSIRDDANNPLNNLQIPSVNSIQEPKHDISIEKIQLPPQHQVELKLESKQSSQIRKIQEVRPYNIAPRGLNNTVYSSGTFNQFQEKSLNYPIQSFRPLSPPYIPPNHFHFIQNTYIPNNLPINQVYHKPITKFSFTFESPSKIKEEQNINRLSSPFQNRDNNIGLNFSRQSNLNFSFRGQTTGGQDTIRNQMINFNSNFGYNSIQQRVSRADSNTSARQRNSQRILTISPNKNESIINKVVCFEKLISRNSSAQSREERKNTIRSRPIMNSPVQKPPILPPRILPPKTQAQPMISTLNKSKSQPTLQIPSNIQPQAVIKNISVSQVPIRMLNSPPKQQIRIVEPPKMIPVKDVSTSLVISPPQAMTNKELAQTLSQHTFSQSIVMKYNEIPQKKFKQRDFIPPAHTSVPLPVVMPKTKSSLLYVTTSHKNEFSKISENSINREKSSTRSRKSNKSRRGISVISKSPTKKEGQ